MRKMEEPQMLQKLREKRKRIESLRFELKWHRNLVDAHRCKRFDDPNSLKLCRRSKLRGVGNDALRLFDARGYRTLSLGFP